MTKSIVTIKPKELNNLDSLTFKQKAFLKRYFETGNGTKAALEVYDCKDVSSAAEIASQNLGKLKNPIKAFMEAKGLSMGYLVGVVGETLQATKPNEFTGEKQPDHPARLKAVEIAARWLGEFKQQDDPENLKRRIVAEEFFQ